MTKNIYFFGDYAHEFSVDLHIEKAKHVIDTKDSFMYITISRLENNMGDLKDYTVILNGLPTPKILLKVCGSDRADAREIIDCLKNDACKYAIKYWRFDKDEWEQNLELAYKEYLEKSLDDDEKELFGIAEAICAQLPQDADIEDEVTIEKLPIGVKFEDAEHAAFTLDSLLMDLGHGDWAVSQYFEDYGFSIYENDFGEYVADVRVHKCDDGE